jgi:hypothetical protein
MTHSAQIAIGLRRRRPVISYRPLWENTKIQNTKPHQLVKSKELMTEYKMNRKTIIHGKILKNIEKY